MGGGHEGELLHRREHRVVHEARPAEGARVHGLEADRGEVADRAERPSGAHDLVEAAADGRVVVGAVPAGPADALDLAPCAFAPVILFASICRLIAPTECVTPIEGRSNWPVLP